MLFCVHTWQVIRWLVPYICSKTLSDSFGIQARKTYWFGGTADERFYVVCVRTSGLSYVSLYSQPGVPDQCSLTPQYLSLAVHGQHIVRHKKMGMCGMSALCQCRWLSLSSGTVSMECSQTHQTIITHQPVEPCMP